MAECQWRVTVEPVGDYWATHRPVVAEFETVVGATHALDLLAARFGPPVTVDPTGKYRAIITPINGGYIPSPVAQ